MVSRIFFFSLPEVGGKATATEAPYVTIETVSTARKLLINKPKADFNSGSLFGRSIDPETSMSKTRLAGGIRAGSIFRAQICRKSSRSPSFHGHSESSECSEKTLSLGGSV